MVKGEKQNENESEYEKNNEIKYNNEENNINTIQHNTHNIQIYKDKRINFMNPHKVNMYHDNMSKNERTEKIRYDSRNEEKYIINDDHYDYEICNNYSSSDNNKYNDHNEYNTYKKHSHITTPNKRSYSFIQQNVKEQYEETHIYDIKNDIHDNENDNKNKMHNPICFS
ncbi:hypothetical protein PFDG_04785 [Plasmodium falciparum Dd2]|uniref:Uncharacterized protein n=1 Tax=Plasmodium falciparum (isolate Dd2) TaxID=57267 RepID=A0A0L7M8Q7_PLAF4|nr:hypothetical protein PFDG_04785 [Plasmodium falciparum Dd2]